MGEFYLFSLTSAFISFVFSAINRKLEIKRKTIYPFRSYFFQLFVVLFSSIGASYLFSVFSFEAWFFKIGAFGMNFILFFLFYWGMENIYEAFSGMKLKPTEKEMEDFIKKNMEEE